MPDIFTDFEAKWFGAPAFFKHMIIPWIIISVLAFIIAAWGGGENQSVAMRNRVTLVLFFSLYFLVVRLGLWVMTKNLHDSLKKDFGDQYAQKLSTVPDFGYLGLKLGATLARFKTALIAERAQARKRFKK